MCFVPIEMECPSNVTVCTDSGPYDMVRQVVLPTHTRPPPPSPRFPFQKISVRMQDLENAAVQSSYFRTRVYASVGVPVCRRTQSESGASLGHEQVFRAF